MFVLKRLSLFIIILVAVTAGAGYAGGKKGVKRKPPQRSVYTEDDILVRPVMNVPAVDLGQKGLLLDKPFDRVKAIRKLIPGRYYHIPDYEGSKDMLDLVVWKSKDYHKKRFAGWFLDEPPEIFPYTDGNITQAGQTLSFTDDSGKKNIIFSFATHHLSSVDDLGNGRYSCVMMGLAWFKEEDRKWSLKYFTPGIGCYGAFQTLPSMNLIKLGEHNYGVYILNSNGGPGQVYYSTLYLFAIVNGQFKIVLMEDAVERTNTMSSSWYPQLSLIKIKSDSDNSFQPLSLRMDGNFNRNIPDPEYDTTDSPIELAKAIIGRDSFDFRVTRRFEFNNGKYRKVSAKYRVK